MNLIKQSLESAIRRYWPALLIGAVWLWFCWPILIGQQVVGFRDSAYLYYPLFKWIDAQWAAGEIPLWNPYCNYGMPVVADGTSSVFYPGKLIFFFRFLSYPARYGIYLAVHLPMAAAGCYWLARTLRANQAGATLAALSFAFGGSVLFQVTNAVYLVSAAWLPFALCCVWKMVKTEQLKWAVGAGVCCALMILGGDPQMVYHVGLIAVATLVGESRRKGRRRNSESLDSNRDRREWVNVATRQLGGMVAVTILLSAIQLFPTFVWSSHSERIHPNGPANIYHLAKTPDYDHPKVFYSKLESYVLGVRSSWEGNSADQTGAFKLVEPPAGVIGHAYQFSQPPWSLLELVFPNFSGKPFPINQRWASGLPGADRVWVPSLYLGVIVFLLALMGFRLWGRAHQRVWLSRLFLFFCVASFGWYGGVWLINELFQNPKSLNALGPQVGGIYWAMNMLLPKYFAFRYPAKLFLVASLALSLLAGVYLRQLTGKQFGSASALLVGVCLTAIGIKWLVFGAGFLAVPADPLFGPFDSKTAETDLLIAFVQPLVVLGLIWGISLLSFLYRKNRRSLCNTLMWTIVLVSSLDLLFANHWLVPKVNASRFESPTQVAIEIDRLKREHLNSFPIQIFRPQVLNGEPDQWAWSHSDNRLDEIVTWQRESIYPKQHLQERVIVYGSFSSIWPAAYQSSLDRLLASVIYADVSHTSWNQRFAVADSQGFRQRGGMGPMIVPANASKSFSPPAPVFWLGDLQPGEELTGQVMTDQISATLESRITDFSNNRFVATVEADQIGSIGFMRIADAGWKATVTNLSTDGRYTAQVEVNVDHELLYIRLDQAGKYEIEFEYSPIEFWIGLWLSGAGWLAVLLAGVYQWRNRKT